MKKKQQNHRYGHFSCNFVIEETLVDPNRIMTLLLLLSLKIILVIVKQMNILDVEEMAEVEKLLLKEESHLPYTFIPLESSLMATLHDFTSSCFLPPTQQVH